MEPIRIGLIGFGAWVRSAYLPALEYDGRAKVTAVAAASERTRRSARELLGSDVELYSGPAQLLQQARVDAVMAAVPDAVHQEALAAALDAQIPVFYEPPISHLREQLPGMADRLLAAKRPAFAHLELGFHPAVERAAGLIRAGAVGTLQNVTITLHAGWGCTEHSDLNLISRMTYWYIDMLNRIAGGFPDRVLLLDGHGGTERMHTWGMGLYDYQGVWGVFRADVARPGEASIDVEAAGTKGTLRIDYFSGELQFQPAPGNPAEPFREDCSPQKPYADYPAVRETVSAFLDSVTGAGPDNAGAVARLSRIALAAERSKDTGAWVQVDP